MPTFRIYNVVDKTTGAIVKIGSTVRTLQARQWEHPYTTDRYKNCELVLRREFEHDDKDFGLLLLRVREQMEIGRAHTWVEQGGWNISEPANQYVFGYGTREACQAGGRIGGRISGPKVAKKQKENGTGIYAMTFEQMSIRSKKIGARHVETGQIQALGRKQGQLNSKTGQVQAIGRKEAQKQKDTNTGIFNPEVRLKAGKIQGNRNVESGHWASLNTPEQQKRATWSNAHKRCHIPQNKFNPRCMFCIAQQIAS